MPWALQQHFEKSVSASGVNTANFSPNNAVLAGSLLLIAANVRGAAETFTAPSDTLGNTWNTGIFLAAGTGDTIKLFWAVNGATSSTDTFSLTFSQAFGEFEIMEFAPPAGSTVALDNVGTTSDSTGLTTATVSLPSYTSAGADDLLIMLVQGSAAVAVSSVNSPWTGFIPASASTSCWGYVLDATAGTRNAAATLGNATAGYVAGVQGFTATPATTASLQRRGTLSL